MKFQLDKAKQSIKFIKHNPIMNCTSSQATSECVHFAGFPKVRRRKEYFIGVLKCLRRT